MPIIILAAGPSSRLGQPKQLLIYKNETLLHRTVRKAVESRIGPIICVVGAHAEQVKETVQHFPTHLALNAHWHNGMGSSIKCGLQVVLQQFSDAPAVIISVCDQVYLEARHFRELAATFQPGIVEVVVSRYANGTGVPCLFSKKFFPSLMELSDEQGAKRIVLENSKESAFISFPLGDIDVDTLTDWEAIKKMHPSVQT